MTIGDLDREWLGKDDLITVVGLDEVGKGAWAGPVTVAAVAIQSPTVLVAMGVNDSKQLSPPVRDRLAPLIKDKVISWAIQHVGEGAIDRIGIEGATAQAAQRAFEAVAVRSRGPLVALMDGYPIKVRFQEAWRTNYIPKGDTKSAAIAAASIIAKVSRDRLMSNHYDIDYPGYYFHQHKGYGTKLHTQCLEELGPCGCHRMSFKPIKRHTPNPIGVVRLKKSKELAPLLEAPLNAVLETVMELKLEEVLKDTRSRLILDGTDDNKLGLRLMYMRRVLCDQTF
jgi:ribonuclease HII